MISFLLLNVFLFVGTYLTGCLPISFNIQKSRLRLLTVFGAGLLLGAALVVIIPEGVNSLYESHKNTLVNSREDVDRGSAQVGENQHIRKARNADAKPAVFQLPGQERALDNQLNQLPLNHEAVSHNMAPATLFPMLSTTQHIGLALLSGYVFMLLVDQLMEPLLQSRCCVITLNQVVSRCRCCQSASTTPASTGSTSATTSSSGANGGGRRRITATLGFVFHSLADGLALGAAFAVDQVQLELVLFLAIILHKVPAAFGLACYLLHEGFSRPDVRLHLLIFSAASPLAALTTYAYLVWPSADEGISNSSAKTGFALLLSGGTFLYVAASHVLPDIISHGSHDGDASCDSAKDTQESTDYTLYTMNPQDPMIVYTPNDRSTAPLQRLKCLDLCLLLVGSIVPLFLTLGHSH